MEVYLAMIVTLFFVVSFYFMLARSILRILLGIAVMSNAVNLLIFIAGRITRDVPPILDKHVVIPFEAIANPLPQALILTAIVISFSLLAFIFVLAYIAYEELGSDKCDEMRFAEPNDNKPVKLEY